MAALAGEDAAAQLPACRTLGERSAQFTGCKPRHDTLVDAGGGECAAECVATGAARRRRGQHVALNVVCRRGMRVEAEGSCTSKHSALEGGEGGLDADHACEALDAAAAGGRRALLHDVAHDHTHESRFRAALWD